MFWTKKKYWKCKSCWCWLYSINVIPDILYTVFTFTTVAYFNFVKHPKQNHQVLHTQKSQKYPIYNKIKSWRIWNQTDLDVSV